MSYEGYEQRICEQGHYTTLDAMENYGGFGSDPLCEVCNGKIAWSNSVDQTNGPSEGEIPDEILAELIVTPAVYEDCPTCHHRELICRAVYRIPTARDEAYFKTLRTCEDVDI